MILAVLLAEEKKKKSGSLMMTLVLVLSIAVAVMGVLTAMRFFEAQGTTPENDTVNRLTEFVNANPDNLQARLQLAYAYQKQQRWDEAKQIYSDVLNVDPANQAALYNIAIIDLDNKNYTEAEKGLKDLITKHPDHILGLAALSEVYLDIKKPDLAIQAADKGLESRPDLIDLHLTKGKALEMKGDKAKAKAEYNAVLKYVPDETRAIEALARLK